MATHDKLMELLKHDVPSGERIYAVQVDGVTTYVTAASQAAAVKLVVPKPLVDVTLVDKSRMNSILLAELRNGAS